MLFGTKPHNRQRETALLNIKNLTLVYCDQTLHKLKICIKEIDKAKQNLNFSLLSA